MQTVVLCEEPVDVEERTNERNLTPSAEMKRATAVNLFEGQNYLQFCLNGLPDRDRLGLVKGHAHVPPTPFEKDVVIWTMSTCFSW